MDRQYAARYVARDALARTYPRIVTLGDNVGESVLHRDVEFDFGIGLQELRNDRGKKKFGGGGRYGQAQCSGGFGTEVVQGIERGLISTTCSRAVRFSELEKSIPGVSQKMLIQHLRELARDGIVVRTVYPQVPPKVEYALTKWGRAMCPALD